MSGKKRSRVTLEDVLERPWCYYCERDFDNLKVLLDHQKAKHFKCETCGRRLNTAGGLHVHMSQVHKEPLSQVENAIPGRHTGDIEIFGMEGIPTQILEEFRQRTIAKYYEEHGPPVQQKQGQPKQIKKETPEELKARLAAFRAKKAAAQNNSTPAAETPAPADASQEGGNNADLATTTLSPTLPQGQPQHTPEVTYPGYPQPSPDPAGLAPPNMMPGFPPPFPMPQQYGQPPYGAPPQPFGAPQWGGPPQFPPMPQNFPPTGPPFQGPPGLVSFSPPPQAFPHLPQHSPAPGPPGLAAPLRTPSLTPAPPGLPQKPSFTPSVSQFELQQMHQGSARPSTSHGDPIQTHPNEDVNMKDTPQQTDSNSTTAAVDALIAEYAPKPAQSVNSPAPDQIAGTQAPETTDQASAPAPATKAKKGKSKVEKTFKLKLQDNERSPEEKLASSPRYSFSVETRREQEMEANTVLGEIEAQVTGPERGEVDIADKTE